MHGNAILTKFDIIEVAVVPHRQVWGCEGAGGPASCVASDHHISGQQKQALPPLAPLPLLWLWVAAVGCAKGAAPSSRGLAVWPACGTGPAGQWAPADRPPPFSCATAAASCRMTPAVRLPWASSPSTPCSCPCSAALRPSAPSPRWLLK